MKAQSDRRGMEHRTMQDIIAPETLKDGQERRLIGKRENVIHRCAETHVHTHKNLNTEKLQDLTSW